MLSPSQYGFRKNLSTIKAVEDVVSHVMSGFEAKKETSAVLLDLSKAFDVVPHNVLIKKLQSYNIKGKELLLMETYLTDRYQFVKISEEKSDVLRVLSGVPQGSVLGPFLFVIFVNDLPAFIPDKCILYADDTTLLTSSANSETNCIVKNYMVERSNLWFCANQLSVNSSKTEEIVFSLCNLDDKTVKLLGITLDCKLGWHHHTSNLCTRLSRVVFLLSKLKQYTNDSLVINAYYAFFHSHILYGLILWGNAPGAKEVFKWQKRAIRCVSGIGFLDSCRSHFTELGILTVPSMYILQCLIYVKEHLDEYNLRGSCHEHNTRNKGLIDCKYVRLSKTQHSYGYIGVKLFNKLPLAAKNVTVHNFKNVLQNWLKIKAFYCVEDWETADMSDLKF
ncbi:hypothetical protein J6590_108515 [Homalodisca vitripennis]|nr:hypothetical protein J6590_108515 [Homalodisca vitripennis]